MRSKQDFVYYPQIHLRSYCEASHCSKTKKIVHFSIYHLDASSVAFANNCLENQGSKKIPTCFPVESYAQSFQHDLKVNAWNLVFFCKHTHCRVLFVNWLCLHWFWTELIRTYWLQRMAPLYPTAGLRGFNKYKLNCLKSVVCDCAVDPREDLTSANRPIKREF